MKVAIIGGGRFGLEVVTYLRDLQRGGMSIAAVGILDDRPVDLDDFPAPVEALGALAQWRPHEWLHVLAVGDAVARWQLARTFEQRGAAFASIIHPSAYVAESARIAAGSVICPLAFVGPKAEIEAHAVVNVQASVGHDVTFGRASVLSPGAKLNGASHVGEATFIGSLAAVAPHTVIGRFCKVAAGAIVQGEHADGSLVAGNPARSRVMFREPAG